MKKDSNEIETTNMDDQEKAYRNATPRVITRNTKKPRIHDDLTQLKKMLSERRFKLK